MYHHQTITGPPKQCPKKLNQAPWTICYTEKMKTPPKGTTVDTNKLQSGELIHINLDFYSVTSIHGFISTLVVVFEKTRMLWVFTTTSKCPPIRIINFILTKMNKEQYPCKCVRVDKYGALENSTEVTKLLVDDFRIYMGTTGGGASWINENNEKHNISIHNTVKEVLLDSNQHAKIVMCSRKIIRSLYMKAS